MRILILVNNIDELGGAQRVSHVLAQGLAERGHDVTLVGMVPHATTHDYRLEAAYRSVIVAPKPLPKDPLQRAAAERALATDLQRLIDDGPPGIIISAQLWSMEFAERCALAGWRVIGQYHSSFEAAAAGRDLARAKTTYRDLDAFALLCDGDTEAFAAAGFVNVLTMPNPLPYWPEVPAALADSVVTYLGRLSAEKGPRFLIEAWRMIAPDYPQWRLQMIGSGPLRDSLEVGVAGEDLRIDFYGPTDDPQSALLSTSILALPSLTEGSPLVLAEALASGVACIASDCSSGVRALVDDEVSGLIAKRGDAVHLAEQLRRLMDSAELRQRLGSAARASVADRQLSSILDRWEELFADVCR